MNETLLAYNLYALVIPGATQIKFLKYLISDELHLNLFFSTLNLLGCQGGKCSPRNVVSDTFLLNWPPVNATLQGWSDSNEQEHPKGHAKVNIWTLRDEDVSM